MTEPTTPRPEPARIAVTLVRGLAGAKRRHREVVRGLGLRRVGMTVFRPDNPMIRGMVARASHLLRLEPQPPAAPAEDAHPDSEASAEGNPES